MGSYTRERNATLCVQRRLHLFLRVGWAGGNGDCDVILDRGAKGALARTGEARGDGVGKPGVMGRAPGAHHPPQTPRDAKTRL